MKNKIETGHFKNGIKYLKIGSESKIAIMFLGGPGNTLPKGLAAIGFTTAMKKFTKEFTIYLVCRKPNLTKGYSIYQMSEDYAEIIENEFNKKVDLIIGFSYGGLIAQYFCARFPFYAKSIVIGGSAHKISSKAKEIDYNFAKYIYEKNDRKAMAIRSEAVFQNVFAKNIFYIFLWVFGKFFLGNLTDEERKDTMIEAEAEMSYDSTDILEKIDIPVLIVCGKDDFAFDVNDVKEMATKIKNSKLLIYNCDHSSVIFYKTFFEDVMSFYNRH